ncbi:MAG TPA: hypothetical protein VFA81_03660 [Burkholderiales bacterium]|nr:hypothetical protein [Burkholderiales bacterium]
MSGQTAIHRSYLPRVAALLAVVLVVVLWGGILLRKSLPNGQVLLGQGVDTTGAAFITPIALAAALGLWFRTVWGWWLSLIAIGWQLTSYLLFLIIVLASGDRTGILTWLTGALLLGLLIVILLPGVRNACLKRPISS